MADMLVKLYDINYDTREDKLKENSISIKKASIIDKDRILGFVRSAFPNEKDWPNECEYALFNNPVSCWIAVMDKEIIGFACYDATAKGFFGPTGVREDCRGLGAGRALALRSFYSMREAGYAYAIIGWTAGKAIGFYQKIANAVIIEDSPPEKSAYHNLISK